MNRRTRRVLGGSAERVHSLRSGSTVQPAATAAFPEDRRNGSAFFATGPPPSWPCSPSHPARPPHAINATRHPLHCPTVLPSGFCIGEHLGQCLAQTIPQATPRSQREVAPAGRALGRYLAGTPRFQRESSPVDRTRVLFCKRSGVFKGIQSLCKRYNTCKVWYRCTSGGISMKAAPAAPPLRDAPRCGGRTAPTRLCLMSRRTLMINTMRYVSRVKALARFPGRFTHDSGAPSRGAIRAHHVMRD